MGVPRKRNDTAYARYVNNGGRIVAIRIPPEMASELEMRTKKKGLSVTGYIKTALYWYMKKEAVTEEQWDKLVKDYERPVGTVEN